MSLRRAIGVAGLLALAVWAAGCKGRIGSSDAAAASTPPAAVLEPPAPARPATPLTFEQKLPVGEVSLKLSRDVSRWPALHREIYARGVADLRRFLVQAQTDHAGASGGEFQPRPYARDLEWTLAAATPKLVSLKQTYFEDTSGAHPNHGYDTYLWDVAAGRSIGNAALFRADGDDAVVQKALCDGIDKAKTERGVEWDPETYPCPKWRQTRFVLVPSTTPNKVGGLMFLFDPYAIGAYVEGEYEVTLPLSVIAPVLSPAYAGEFSGVPQPPAQKPG